MKVAIQGMRGSFHEQAAKELFTSYDYDILERETFRDVFSAVSNDTADYGVVAVENSLHGTINPVYKLLAEQQLQVCAETRLHIKLYLIGHDNMGLDMVNVPITEVLSQREALSQCEVWLAHNLEHARLTETNDTAASVQQVMQEQTHQKLAIASWEAAQLYHAEILAGPINDETENYTRFFVISKQAREVPDANRTSIILNENTDKSGMLYAALGVFSELGINLSKLHSQPRPGIKRLYSFYIDFDESSTSPTGQKALSELEKLGWNIQVLGTYKASDNPTEDQTKH